MSLDTPHAKPLYNVKNPFIARLKRVLISKCKRMLHYKVLFS